MPLVYIIILNWNDYQSTLSCIESLKQMDYPNFRIFVIDNYSTNESMLFLAEIPGIELLRNNRNLGYAGGCNQGMGAALARDADYIWLLNNDATVAPDCLRKLVIAAEQDPGIGLLSPVVYEADAPDQVQHGGSRYDLAVPEIVETSDIATVLGWQQNLPHQVLLWGTALFVPARTIRTIGLYDERLFCYAEDLDYGMRSSLAGLRNVMVADAAIWHQSYTGIRKPHYYYYTTRNSFHFWRRYLPLKQYLRICRWVIARTLGNIAKFADSPEHVQACLLGVWDGLRGAYPPYDAARRAPGLLLPLLKRLV